ncbi:TetR/AcrR family transcriptional regulator [Mycolicibacterium fortuitum]|uniref:TetR/AcrR family transcriptional regulator n=1 Tax=Mycolicibacterium fortuitum TaxID=1766 RepID=UPI0022BA333E|nr:TetR/AcrR family transcriptional regulator [Mycolicibacterium fortuitum]WAY19665.1 TetR/AcrR family transcriptional regulator [Mycolicibacterium fortuitum]
MTGRRTRNMQDKQQRIFAAARSLFEAHGFEPVTVAQIAEAADVAAGTLFRYASSKAELLLMVYNDQFRQAIETGMRNAADVEDPSAAVFAMVAPVISEAARQPGNATAYQRELLFGSPTERFRAEGLDHVMRLEDAIAERLMRCHPADLSTDNELRANADRAARSVFAALHLLVVQPSTGMKWGTDGAHELFQQINQIVLGFLATTTPREGEAP